MPDPETVEIELHSEPDGSVIWLHGLGADGHDFEPIVPELSLPAELKLRFVFPHAPVRPVTINGGASMRAWYDIFSLDRDGPLDEAGIAASTQFLVRLIEREHERGSAYRRIVLAGFSQGGAIAANTAMNFEPPLAGLMALSTYLPLREAPARTQQRKDLPLFMAHGSLDSVLPLALGQSARDTLSAAGFDVAWHEYPMAHSVCADEIDDIRGWLVRVFA